MITFLGKPLEEMTIPELKRERYAHMWLLNLMNQRIKKMENYRANIAPQKREAWKKPPPNYAEQYINGLITEKEYRTYKLQEDRNRAIDVHSDDRLNLAKKIREHNEIYLSEINELLEIDDAEKLNARKRRLRKERRMAIKKPTKRVLPKSYGYDPRKNDSLHNYRRDDWGHTRENKKLHEYMKSRKK